MPPRRRGPARLAFSQDPAALLGPSPEGASHVFRVLRARDLVNLQVSGSGLEGSSASCSCGRRRGAGGRAALRDRSAQDELDALRSDLESGVTGVPTLVEDALTAGSPADFRDRLLACYLDELRL